MDTDMTRGNPYGHLIRFSIPIFIGSLCQLLYSTVDAVIVGRFVGLHALAAIGATGSFIFLTIGFGQGLTMGFSILISQRYGAKDAKGLKKTYAMAIVCTAIMSAFFTVLALTTSAPLLRIMRTPQDIFNDAKLYLAAMYAGLSALFFYNMFSSVLNAIGDSRSPLCFLLLASALNIMLDLLFVIAFGWGCIGVGVATVISQAVSAILCFIYINRKYPFLRLERNDWKMDGSVCRSLLRLGIPGALQNSVCAIGCIVVQGAVNDFGSQYVASFSISLKIEGFLMAIFPVYGNAIATYSGQNLGAGNYERIKKGFAAMTVIGLVTVAIVMVFGWFTARPLTMIFIDSGQEDPVVIENSVRFIRTVIWAFIWLASIFIFRTGCQGLGSASIPMYSSIGELVARCITAFTLPGLIGYTGVILSENFAWTTGGIICPVCWIFMMKKIKRRLCPVAAERNAR